jgi:hypothetical protein
MTLVILIMHRRAMANMITKPKHTPDYYTYSVSGRIPPTITQTSFPSKTASLTYLTPPKPTPTSATTTPTTSTPTMKRDAGDDSINNTPRLKRQRSHENNQVDHLLLLEIDRLVDDHSLKDDARLRSLENWLDGRRKCDHHLSTLMETILAQLGWDSRHGLFESDFVWPMNEIRQRINAALRDQRAAIQRECEEAKNLANARARAEMSPMERHDEAAARALQEQYDRDLAIRYETHPSPSSSSSSDTSAWSTIYPKSKPPSTRPPLPTRASTSTTNMRRSYLSPSSVVTSTGSTSFDQIPDVDDSASEALARRLQYDDYYGVTTVTNASVDAAPLTSAVGDWSLPWSMTNGTSVTTSASTSKATMPTYGATMAAAPRNSTLTM